MSDRVITIESLETATQRVKNWQEKYAKIQQMEDGTITPYGERWVANAIVDARELKNFYLQIAIEVEQQIKNATEIIVTAKSESGPNDG